MLPLSTVGVTWSNIYIISLHISQYAVMLILKKSALEDIANFQPYYKAFVLWLLSETNAWVWEKAAQRLNQAPVKDELHQAPEFKHWFSTPMKLDDVTPCHCQWSNVAPIF